MNDDEKEGENRNDDKSGLICEPEGGTNAFGEPLCSVGGQKRGAERDADAEDEQRAPVDAVDDAFPVHHAHARQHKERNGAHCRSRRIKGVELLFRHPHKEEYEGDDRELPFSSGHGSEFCEFTANGIVAARNIFERTLKESSDDHIEHDAHQSGERCSSDKPVKPGNIMTGQFLNEPHGDHILGSGSLDADIPHAVDLCNRDEEHGAESTLQRESEGAHHAGDDRHEAGNARSGRRHKERENEAAENDAEHNARRRRADFGERNEGNSAVKPRLHHGCREEERRADKAEGG